jgi:hypothetical protein
MSEMHQVKRLGRHSRNTPPVRFRATLPETSPLNEALAGLSSREVGRRVLELAAIGLQCERAAGTLKAESTRVVAAATPVATLAVIGSTETAEPQSDLGGGHDPAWRDLSSAFTPK